MNGRFLIDTGAPSIAIALAPRFVHENNLRPDTTIQTVTLPSLCATSSFSRYGEMADIDIGPFQLRKVSVLLSRDRSGAFADGAFDGIIGGSLLRLLGEIVLDVPNGRLLVKSAPAR